MCPRSPIVVVFVSVSLPCISKRVQQQQQLFHFCHKKKHPSLVFIYPLFSQITNRFSACNGVVARYRNFYYSFGLSLRVCRGLLCE